MSDHALGILGLVIGVLGLIVGGIGIWYAVKSERKMKTAQEARRREVAGRLGVELMQEPED